MATATKSGQSLSFTYNADGLRTTKTVNGVVHTYYYSGSKLVRETYGDYVLDFFYDQNGTPFMLLQNGNIYYYITNAQGDVIRLVDINGNVAASYRYDPYGKATSALGSHANINPLRYRGYVFDHETGLYYLQSRYYDPEIGRFINSDTYMATGSGLIGNNMFAYCLNNPVNMADSDGKDAIVVVEYIWGENGLPVVGHISLYIQDADGNWHFTEYTGEFPDKSTATVEYREATAKDMELITRMLQGKYIRGKQYLRLEGDFSDSVDLAETLDGSDLGGYLLVGNSCLDYIQTILSVASYESPLVATAVWVGADTTLAPYDYIAQLRRVSMISKITKFAIEVTCDVGKTLPFIWM